jgi:uncharacterized protein (TIGR02186 family)
VTCATARRLLALLILLLPPLLPGMAAAQERAEGRPPLVAELSQARVEVTTAFTGAQILVFGATERLLGETEESDQVLVVATGPTQPMVVRRRVQLLGLIWVNGPSARFHQVPGYYAIAGTRPAWQLLPEEDRQAKRLGLENLPLVQLGAQGPAFRAALLELKQASGLWVEHVAPLQISGGRLFHARLPLPATVATGDYRVEVMLVRARRVVARQELSLRVERTGTAAGIAEAARDHSLLYGIACIVLAVLAGWIGSVLFRRS